TSGGTAPVVQEQVRTALQALTGPQAELAALIEVGMEPGVAADALEQTRAGTEPVGLPVTNVHDDAGLDAEFAGLGQFDLSAATMLLLFVFLSTLNSAVALIDSRRLG